MEKSNLFALKGIAILNAKGTKFINIKFISLKFIGKNFIKSKNYLSEKKNLFAYLQNSLT